MTRDDTGTPDTTGSTAGSGAQQTAATASVPLGTLLPHLTHQDWPTVTTPGNDRGVVVLHAADPAGDTVTVVDYDQLVVLPATTMVTPVNDPARRAALLGGAVHALLNERDRLTQALRTPPPYPAAGRSRPPLYAVPDAGDTSHHLGGPPTADLPGGAGELDPFGGPAAGVTVRVAAPAGGTVTVTVEFG